MDEATVERCAKIAFGQGSVDFEDGLGYGWGTTWDEMPEWVAERWCGIAKAVIAAFVAEDPVRRAAQRWVDLFDFVHDYDAGDWWRETDAAWNDLKTALAGDAKEGET